MPKKPKRKPKQFTAWSYSRLKAHETCPLLAKLQFLDKLPEEEGKALTHGRDVHEKAERYVKKQIKRLPKVLELFDEEFKALRKRKGVVVELELAVNKKWQPVDWFASDAWARAKIDVLYYEEDNYVVIIDYKTGKVRPENVDQLDLYATILFAHKPTLRRVDGTFWYTDQGEVVSKSYTAAEGKKMRKMWERRTRRMMADKIFRATPCYKCRWCSWSKAKGGPCKH